MSLATDLLALADELCPAGSGRPSHAQLRRCISTAYYAAFHALGDEVARPYAPGVRITAHRMLEHGSARDVANTIAKKGSVIPWLAGKPTCDACLQQFGDDFEQLQLARHRADYDLAYAPTKRDALTAIERAKRAISDLAGARQKCPDQLQAMCVAMIAGPNLRRRMSR